MKMGMVRTALARWALKPVLKTMTGDDLLHYFGRVMPGAGNDPFTKKSISDLQDYYKLRSIIFDCINLISKAYVTATLEIGTEGTDNQFKAEQSSEIIALLKQPNPWMSWSKFSKFRLSNMLTTGRSYTWKWRKGGTRGVGELWPLPTSWVKPIYVTRLDSSSERIVESYDVTIFGTGQVKNVAPQDMAYEYFVDPTSYSGAISPLQAAIRDVELDEERENYLMEMLTNLHAPGIVINTGKYTPTPDDKKDIRAALRDLIGKGHRGDPLIISGEGGGMEMPAPLSDLDWPGLSKLTETRICAAFGVPPTLLGLRSGLETTGMSPQDVDAAERIFYHNTMMPLWDADAQGFTQAFIAGEGSQGPGTLEFRFNTSKVKALQPDLSAMSQVVSTLVNGSIVKIGQAQEMCGLPVDPERKDTYLMPVGMMEMKGGEVIPPPVKPTLPGQGPGHTEPEPWGGEGNEPEPEAVAAAMKGGPGSGNIGHEGRPGEVGGSAPGGGGGGKPKPKDKARAWTAPPPPRGKAGQRRKLGYASNGKTNTEVGNLGEQMTMSFGLRSLLKNKRQGPFDVGKGRDVYEVKVCTVGATEYKIKMKAEEAAGKLAYAKSRGLRPNVMILVLDTANKTGYAYRRPGVGSYRLNSEEWTFMGKVKVSG